MDGYLRVFCFLIFAAVTLSKTKKKGREHKECIVNGIREAVDRYSSVYVFSFENMRNIKFKEFRQQFRHNGKLVSFFFLFMLELQVNHEEIDV